MPQHPRAAVQGQNQDRSKIRLENRAMSHLSGTKSRQTTHGQRLPVVRPRSRDRANKGLKQPGPSPASPPFDFAIISYSLKMALKIAPNALQSRQYPPILVRGKLLSWRHHKPSHHKPTRQNYYAARRLRQRRQVDEALIVESVKRDRQTPCATKGPQTSRMAPMGSHRRAHSPAIRVIRGQPASVVLHRL
jgi:hypothetical protein